MDKKELKYHIFKVYDYKGGELSTDINLTFNEFIKAISESIYENIDSDEIVENLEKVKELVIDNLPESELYAGGDGEVFELYVSKNNELVQVTHDDFIDDIAEQILEWYKED